MERRRITGGRGASFGKYTWKGKEHTYGDEYSTVLKSGNINFVKINEGSATAPMETMTNGRVYVTIGNEGEPKFVSYYDKRNKRKKQIDLRGQAHKINGEFVLPHTHKGYIHAEKGTYNLSEKEKKLVERIYKIWYNSNNKK